MKTPLIALAAIGSALSATSAAAEQIDIEFDDLNLASISGQETLERRIDRAARKVCGVDIKRPGTRIPSVEAKKCYVQARNSALAQMAAAVDERSLGG